jgi:hypothetical protein
MPGIFSKQRWRAGLAPAVILAALSHGPVVANETATDELIRRASWSLPEWGAVRGRLLDWWAGHPGGDTAAEAAAESFWPADEPPADDGIDRLDRAVATMALLDTRAASILAHSADPSSADDAWLREAATTDDPVERGLREILRLYQGRQLVRHGYFESGLDLLGGLEVESSLDPAALLFHRAACEHWLLRVEPGLETLDRLLERSGEIPVRYEMLARLMREDLAGLEDDSLDHIARRMRDITRRLDFGHAGPRTREIQDGVIDSLDKLIAKLEQQQQQQQSQSAGAGGGSGGSGSRPMDDSRPAGGRGPGEVARRDLDEGEAWGDLPPREREEALQQIGREFPPHYREAIEQYFKRLASGDSGP